MKIVRTLPLVILASGLFLPALSAAPAIPGSDDLFPSTPEATPTTGEPTYTLGPSNPSADPDPAAVDPDAVPLAFSHPQKSATSADKATLADEKKKRTEDRDWLVHAYEKQLMEHPLKGGPNNSSDFYTSLSRDKDLAKAAGLNIDDASSDDPLSMDLHTGLTDPEPTAELRPDPAADSTDPDPAASLGLKPYSAPVVTSMAEELAPYAAPSPFQPLDSPAVANQDDETVKIDAPVILDRGAMDIPGMTAAEGDPNRAVDDDLSLDLLPGETIPDAKAHQDLELPLSTDAQRLEKQREVAMAVPGQKSKAAIVPKAIPVVYPSDTANMVPDLHPLRGTVPDPFDILR